MISSDTQCLRFSFLPSLRLGLCFIVLFFDTIAYRNRGRTAVRHSLNQHVQRSFNLLVQPSLN